MSRASIPLRPAVFLDRDGVLNAAEVSDGKPLAPTSVDRLRVLPRVAEACVLLRAAGYFLIIVTNQPDLARGLQTAAAIEDIHSAIAQQLPIDDIRMCPHDDADNCTCRKPLPGLLLSSAADHHLDLSRSYMVGDRWRDVEAGHRAGCATVLIRNHYNERQAEGPDKVANDLYEAAQWILSSGPSRGERRGL